MTPLGAVEKTDNGFEFILFKDRYDVLCSVQQSSLADYEPPGTSALWLGVNQNVRMHLDLGQVRSLIAVLETWVKCGSFVEDK